MIKEIVIMLLLLVGDNLLLLRVENKLLSLLRRKPNPLKKSNSNNNKVKRRGSNSNNNSKVKRRDSSNKKKEPQEQEQEQEQPEGGKKENDPAAVKGAAQKVISTVKSYGAPWFVADVDIEDNLDDVLTTANLFSEELPDSACMFLSGGTKTFIIVAAVPESKVSGANAIELINTALTVIANPPPAEGTNNLAYSIINADPEKGIFPLKLKDLTRGPVFALLKKRQLVKDEEEEDDLPNWDDIE